MTVLTSGRIRKITPDGYVHAIALGGTQDGENQPALQANDQAGYTAVDPAGEYYYATSDHVRKVGSPLPGVGADDITIPSGGELYVFDRQGRHLRTLNALTRALVYEFSYTSDGVLSTITDGDGNVTSIERTPDGTPIAIIGPYGQRTAIGLDGDGYISSIADPENRAHTITYHAGGLLATFSDPNENESRMTYDLLGRLVKDEDAAGGYKQIEKLSSDGSSGEDKVVTIRTAMGRTTVMRSGNKYLKASSREYVNPDGTITTTEYRNDETTVTRYADGSETTVTQGPDTRYGMMSSIPVNTTISLPSGLTSNAMITQESLYQNPADPLSIRTQTFTVTENWRTSTSVYDFTTRTHTNTSPEGRVSTRTLDTLGRTTSMQVPGFESIHYSYDSRGRLQAITQGTGTDQRQINYNYRTDGFVGSASDALNRLTQFDYDQSGREIGRAHV